MTEVAEIELPDEVAELLEPIKGDSPVGQDANTVDEYFKLNMEIGKVSPNYKICTELAVTILSEKSKDLWVACWLCFSWFRLDGMAGFKNGLSLILNLLQKFGENIHPAKVNYRSKAIQYLNAGRFYKLLEKEEIKEANAKDVLEAQNIFNELVKECTKQFPDNLPVLKSIEQTISDLVEKSKKYAKKEKVPEKVEQPKEEIAEQKQTEEKKPAEEIVRETVEVTKEVKTTSAKTVEISTQKGEPDSAPTTDKEAISLIRKHLKFFFEESGDDKKLKVPNDPYIYSMSRSLVWGKMTLPPNKENITQVDPPNAVIQNKVLEWFTSNDLDVLIPRIELNLLNPDSGFQYWLDVQRFVCKALEQKGGSFTKAAEEIKISLAMLLNRYPQLLDLKFKNKETAFADKDTLSWIKNEVQAVLGSGKGNEEPLLLPPIMGEDYNSINAEYEKACKELPKYFEVNIAKMQSQISGDTRRKGRFLRQLNLANLCVEAKQHRLAKVHLLQLIDKIEEYNLAEWEPALCVAVWQSTYLVNNNLLETEDKESKKLVESEQAKLFAKIANYDGVLAIKLSNKKLNGGK